jgi:hypothetical protein
MAMEMTAVWKERKSRSPFPLFPHCLGKLAKTASFPHSHSFGDDLGFPSSPSSFNFNCNEKCSLHARYLLLPTCQFAQRDSMRALAPEVLLSCPVQTFSAACLARTSMPRPVPMGYQPPFSAAGQPVSFNEPEHSSRSGR